MPNGFASPSLLRRWNASMSCTISSIVCLPKPAAEHVLDALHKIVLVDLVDRYPEQPQVGDDLLAARRNDFGKVSPSNRRPHCFVLRLLFGSPLREVAPDFDHGNLAALDASLVVPRREKQSGDRFDGLRRSDVVNSDAFLLYSHRPAGFLGACLEAGPLHGPVHRFLGRASFRESNQADRFVQFILVHLSQRIAEPLLGSDRIFGSAAIRSQLPSKMREFAVLFDPAENGLLQRSAAHIFRPAFAFRLTTGVKILFRSARPYSRVGQRGFVSENCLTRLPRRSGRRPIINRRVRAPRWRCAARSGHPRRS